MPQKAGNTYYTKGIGQLWNIGPFGSLNPYSADYGNTFERINFFSEDTLMISGFIQNDRKQDFVYWSADHGKTWEKKVFGQSSWIDAAYINNNGKAWMSGSSQLIYYTDDKGKTWKSFEKIDSTEDLRFSTIHFAKDEKTGLFGPFSNALYRTQNNCQNWEKLPTPLTQGKYKPLTENRPEIHKIRIFGNFYIINQQGNIFITPSDHIEWKALPDVIDFEISERENLYIIKKDLSVELFDNFFSKIWQSEQKLNDYPIAIGVKNENLFVTTESNLYKINPNEFITSEILIDQPIEEPYLKVGFQKEGYGVLYNDILKFDPKSRQWYRWMTLDFPILNAIVFNDNLVVSKHDLKKYFIVDTHTKSIRDFELPKNLWGDNEISEFYFENRSSGCFHSSNRQRTYKRKGSEFKIDTKKSSSKFLTHTKKIINENVINELVKTVEDSRFEQISLADLNISEKDILKFKKIVDDKSKEPKYSDTDFLDFDTPYTFHGKNTDFEFYKKAADSLSFLTTKDIDNAFWQVSGIMSTSVDSRRIVFVFKDGKRLTVENNDTAPNYFYTPWVVDYDGLLFRTNSIKLGQLINELTNGDFFSELILEKSHAIYNITDYLYQERLKER